MNMLAEIILTSAWSPIIWKDNYAKTDNFEFSDFLVLDFDDVGDETMDEINHSLQDHKRIIATTKSHQKEKKGIICDRFRLIIPWEKRITCYKTYRQNYAHVLEKYWWADKSCLDGARFFFPSQKIVYLDRESEYTWPTKEYIPSTPHINHTQYPHRIIPGWCLSFINEGTVYSGSRNMTVFRIAWTLLDQGFHVNEVRNFILRSPINWNGVNVESILKSSLKRSQKSE